MFFNFRSPNKQEEAKISENDNGLLKVEVQHWASEVKVYNSLLQPVAEVGKIKSDESLVGYVTETSLEPGVYQVETVLEGKVSSEWIPVRPNQVTQVSSDAWKNLEFTSSAPLNKTDTSREWHQGPAISWSRKTTWNHPQGGNSRLFLFVRTLDPEHYQKTFCDGLLLLNENGELVTDFTDSVVKDDNQGWMAFNADLPSGGYILRRGRKGVLLRSQVIYLCEKWKTQVFLTAKRFPSLSTMSLNITGLNSEFQPDDLTAIAAESILNNLRYGANIQALFSNDKIESILDTLLKRKWENPWFGILVAHIILKFREEMTNRQASEISLNKTNDFSEYFKILEDKVKPFLRQHIPMHPDARALLLSEDKSDCFDFPPMLWASLELIQKHARKFVEAIPKDSLTDIVLDNLVVNSPWTAWRTIDKLPKPSVNTEPSPKSLFDIKAKKILTIPIVSGNMSTSGSKASVYRLPQAETNDFSLKNFSQQTSDTETFFQDAPIIQKATEMVNDYVQSNRLEELPDKAIINSSEQLDKILKTVKAEEISANVGLSLSRAESGLESLKMKVGNIQSDEPAEVSISEQKMLISQQVILEYALNKIEKISSEDAKEFTDTSLSISGLAARLKTESNRLRLNVAENSEQTKIRKICERLNKISHILLSFADFVLLSSVDGRIIYSNRAFIILISPKNDSFTPLSDEEIKSHLIANIKLWETTIINSVIGLNKVKNPMTETGFRVFELRRTEIQDNAEGRPNYYLNILRLENIVSLPEKQIKEIDAVISNLSQYAMLFSYGSTENKLEYTEKLNEIVNGLETFISKRR